MSDKKKTVKKQPKPCDCAEQVNEQLKPRNAAITRSMQFDFDAKKASMSPPQIMVHKIESKVKKPAPALYAAYCPFCGKKYPE